MFCFPCKPFSLLDLRVCQHHAISSHRLPPTQFLLFPELLLIYLLHVLLKPSTSSSVSLDTDVILNNYLNIIKAISAFHPHPIIISQQGSTQFIGERRWYHLPQVRTQTQVFDLCLLGQYIVSSSRVDFKEMVPVSQSMFLCTSRREWQSYIHGTTSVLLFLNADVPAHPFCSLLGETDKSHMFLP